MLCGQVWCGEDKRQVQDGTDCLRSHKAHRFDLGSVDGTKVWCALSSCCWYLMVLLSLLLILIFLRLLFPYRLHWLLFTLGNCFYFRFRSLPLFCLLRISPRNSVLFLGVCAILSLVLTFEKVSFLWQFNGLLFLRQVPVVQVDFRDMITLLVVLHLVSRLLFSRPMLFDSQQICIVFQSLLLVSVFMCLSHPQIKNYRYLFNEYFIRLK